MRIISASKQLLGPTAIALGNFDGVHRGHQRVLNSLISWTQKADNATGIQPTVVSFDPHPRAFFSGEAHPLLTPESEKADLLATLGISQWVVLPFSADLAQLSPQDFVEKILVSKLQARYITVGADFRFGFQRRGTVPDLQAIATGLGVCVEITGLKYEQGQRISSSQIRMALDKGEIAQANLMLGRAYGLQGNVVAGRQLGRTLGFPTANLEVSPDKLLPRWGVYAVQVSLESSPQPLINGVMNIGDRPTVQGRATTVEVHLFDWNGDLYGQRLTVYLLDFLRPEQKFNSLGQLQQQIAQDCREAQTRLMVCPAP